ncbi:MAG TPA: hypothetical protein VM686_21180, partial [Polyangiaceae bacterium]|nr:hypothetical protein [Polyangiaceae bacterium]
PGGATGAGGLVALDEAGVLTAALALALGVGFVRSSPPVREPAAGPPAQAQARRARKLGRSTRRA